MRNRIIIITIIIFITVILILALGRKDNKLVIPGFIKQTKVTEALPTPAPPVTPRTFKFDATTDLKKELDSVNPEVLDSDFNE